MHRATFGAGCFWGVEEAFKGLKGVTSTRVGYTGGHKASPTYEEVCQGQTGHAEVCTITFDPQIITYEDLLAKFWEIHDPTTLNRQGPDIGDQYRSAIFFHSPDQKKSAQLSLNQQQEKVGKSIVTKIEPAGPFYEAEGYHQCYFEKKRQVPTT